MSQVSFMVSDQPSTLTEASHCYLSILSFSPIHSFSLPLSFCFQSVFINFYHFPASPRFFFSAPLSPFYYICLFSHQSAAGKPSVNANDTQAGQHPHPPLKKPTTANELIDAAQLLARFYPSGGRFTVISYADYFARVSSTPNAHSHGIDEDTQKLQE